MNVFELIDKTSRELGEPIDIHIRRMVHEPMSEGAWLVVVSTIDSRHGPLLRCGSVLQDTVPIDPTYRLQENQLALAMLPAVKYIRRRRSEENVEPAGVTNNE